MSDDLRHRFKSHKQRSGHLKAEGIFGIWQEQRRIQLEEEKLAHEKADKKKNERKQRKHVSNQHLKRIKTQAVKKLNIVFVLTSRTIRNNRKIATAALLAVVFVTGGGLWFFNRKDGGQTQLLGLSVNEPIIDSTTSPVEELSFQYIYPNDFESRDIQLKLQKRGQEDFVSYEDIVAGVKITVLQQKALPEFTDANDLRYIENLAKSLPIPATDAALIDNIPFYVGTSENRAKQNSLFVKKEVLVLVTAEGFINESDWINYILSLN